MITFFKVPLTQYTDHYDLARFSLSWRVCWFMLLVISFLGGTLVLVRQLIFYPTFVGSLTLIAFLIILKRTRKYEVIAMTFSLVGTALCQFTLLFFLEEYHMVDIMWILIITLYTFFMLGKKWGVGILAINIVGILVFISLFLNSNLATLNTLSEGHIIGQSINFIICSLLIAFLIFQFLNVIEIAENDFRHVNSELKQQNEIVAEQHKEKTVMLREIHHRVKNNLQVITSLLRLQSDEIEDEKSKEKFDETINRVISMALIHERMYQSEHLSKIDLKGYIDSLAKELINSYQVKNAISLTVSCEIQQVQPKSLVSLALIFNELISNSLKHAFEHEKHPSITISILCKGEHHVEMNYSDNGTWKKEQRKSFGLELMHSLTEQLSGSLEIHTHQGTRFSFTFHRKDIMDEN